jgi:hypothetical protein
MKNIENFQRSEQRLKQVDGATTLSTTALRIMTLSLKGSYASLSMTTLCIKRRYAECHYAEFRQVLFFVVLSVVMLGVIMLSVIMLSVIMLSVIMLNFVRFNLLLC